MRKNTLEQLKKAVAKMMTEENDDHAKLISALSAKINLNKYSIDDTLIKLSLIHETKIETLEEVYSLMRDIK